MSSFASASLSTCKDFTMSGQTKILKDENMLVELPLYGEFEKFNSNTGWSSRVGLLPNAFSHWTWVVSDGEHLVCDLQGYRGFPDGVLLDGEKRHYYGFSDPAVLSRTGEYGPSDLGLKGQEAFFQKHVCNGFCRSLGLEGKVPLPKHGSTKPCQRQTLYVPKQPGL